MPTSEQNRDLLQWAVVLLSLVLVVALGVGYISMTNRTTTARLERVLNGDDGHPGALVRTEEAARDAQTAANRADHTLTSIIDQFTKAAADPAAVAAQLRSRQRLIIQCETTAAVAAKLGLDVTQCPVEPTTTTTTIGPPTPKED